MFVAEFDRLARSLGPRIDDALAASCRWPSGCPAKLGDAMSYSLLAPGKRLRPMLALLAAEACGGAIDAALPAACAVEMVHAYSLIHDDLPAMDDDDLRRGRPTCHKAFGEAMAILAGDALLARAFEILAEGIQPPATAAMACAALAKAAGPSSLVGGQADDMFPPDRESGSRDELLAALKSVHLRKTGAMIRVSLTLGGMAVAASPEPLGILDTYGERLGLAFQVTDDLLDARGTAAAMGKDVQKDAQRGKLTYPGLLGLDQSARLAQDLVFEACEVLRPLGHRARSLEVVARFVLERNR